MKQETSVKIVSDDGKIIVYADNDVALGNMHDFLLNLKGHIVDRMNAAQKEEKIVADSVKKQEEKPEIKE